MKKFLTISMLCGLSGCAWMPFMGPPPATSPATPVFFQPWSASLDDSARTTILSAAKAAALRPEARVIVTGAADSVGPSQANVDLSEARAKAVAVALEGDGVAAGRIETYGIGVAASPAPPGMPAQSARRALIRLRD